MNSTEINEHINEFLSQFGRVNTTRRRKIKRLLLVMGVQLLSDVAKASDKNIKEVANEYLHTFKLAPTAGIEVRCKTKRLRKNRRRRHLRTLAKNRRLEQGIQPSQPIEKTSGYESAPQTTAEPRLLIPASELGKAAHAKDKKNEPEQCNKRTVPEVIVMRRRTA